MARGLGLKRGSYPIQCLLSSDHLVPRPQQNVELFDQSETEHFIIEMTQPLIFRIFCMTLSRVSRLHFKQNVY